MKHILIIVANRDFQDLEFGNPYHIFEQNECEISIASGEGGECFGVFGLKIADSLCFDEIDPKDYDALVFVGWGGAYEQYRWDTSYQALATEFLSSQTDTSKILGAICIAPTLLAESGIFAGKEVTARDDGEETQINFLKEHQALWRGGDVVRDRNIITASGPQASVAFGREIVEALEE